MNPLYFEDLKPGARFQSESLAVPGRAIIEFAEKFDPQMFHLNPKSAERSIFRGLVASGWHTAAITMRLFVQSLNFAEGAIGLGVDELRWPNAVRPDDVLQVETEILEARPSQSKRGFGVIHLRNVTKNQRGEIVQTMTAHALVPRRQGGVRRCPGFSCYVPLAKRTEMKSIVTILLLSLLLDPFRRSKRKRKPMPWSMKLRKKATAPGESQWFGGCLPSSGARR